MRKNSNSMRHVIGRSGKGGSLWTRMKFGISVVSINLLLVSMDGLAEQAEYDLHIPGSTMDVALNALAEKTGAQLLFPYDFVKTRQSQPLSGQYTLTEALDALLRGTNLSSSLTNHGVITISLASNINNSHPEEGMLAGKKSLFSQFSAFVISGLSAASASYAADDEGSSKGKTESKSIREEIVITATKRATNLQDTAASISALDGKSLADRGAVGLDDYIRSIPSVQFDSEGPGTTKLSIRGITSLGGEVSQRATVGYYIDETPISVEEFSPNTATFDVERVEVLRGPQGTLYGEGSLGGTIRIISKQPNAEEYEAEVMTTVSSTEDGGINYGANAMVNIPLVDDTLALRIVGNYQDDDGSIDNIFLGIEDINNTQSYGGRASLLWNASDNLDITLTVYDSTVKTDDTAFNAYEGLVIATPFLEPAEDSSDLYNIKIEYALPFADLVSSSSWYDRVYDGLVDFSPVVIGRLQQADFPFGPGGAGLQNLPFTVGQFFQHVEQKDFTQEIRLVSNGDGDFQWTAGVFYQDKNSDNFILGGVLDANGNPAPGADLQAIADFAFAALGRADLINDESEVIATPLNTNFEKLAIFGEVSYLLADDWELLLGIRAFQEDRTSSSAQIGLFPKVAALLDTPNPADVDATSFDRLITAGDSANAVTTKVNLTRTFDGGGGLAYFTYSEGFGSGGDNPFAVFIQGAPLSYEPEELSNYELGWKTRFADDRVTFNGALFFMEWDDIQVPTESFGVFAATTNAGAAESLGVEFELSYAATDNLDLSIGGSFIKAELSETRANVGAKGARLPGVPEESFNASAQYNIPLDNGLDAMVRIDGVFYGDSPRSLTNNTLNGSYELINLRAGLEADSWSLTAFVSNLTNDVEQRESGSVNDRLRIIQPNPNAQYPLANFIPGQEFSINQPRTIGMSLRKTF